MHQGETVARLSFTLAATLTAQDALSTTETFARIAVADLDGDSLPEIVASSTTINSVSTASEGHVSVFEHAAGNNATYNAATVYVVPFGVLGAGAIAISPVYGADNFPDVIVCDPTVITGTKLAILPGKGDGTLVIDPNDATLPAQQANLPFTGTAIAIGDADGDGHRDIFVAGSQWADLGNGHVQVIQVTLLHNNGTNFDPPFAYPPISSTPSPNAPTNTLVTDLAVGDFNLDGIPDVAVVDSINNAVAVLSGRIFHNATSGAYVGFGLTPAASLDAGQNVRTVATALTDSDANLDLVVGSVDADDTDILLNTTLPPAPPLTGKEIGFEDLPATPGT